MNVIIGNKQYYANPALITLLRYRGRYGVSFLNDLTGARIELRCALTQLLYVAVDGLDKLDYDVFCEISGKDAAFMTKALAFQREVFRAKDEIIKGESNITAGSGGGTFDELEVLTLAADIGLSDFIINNFTIFEALTVIKGILDKKGGSKAYIPMTGDQIMDLYS